MEKIEMPKVLYSQTEDYPGKEDFFMINQSGPDTYLPIRESLLLISPQQETSSSIFLTEKKINALRKILSKEDYGRYGRMKYFEERILPDLEDIFSEVSLSKPVFMAIEKKLTELARNNFYRFDWLIYELREERNRLKNISESEVQSLMELILSRTPDPSSEKDCYGPKYYGEGPNDDLYIWYSGSTQEAVDQLKNLEYSWNGKSVLEIAPGQDGEFINWVKSQGADAMASDKSFRGTRWARQKYGVESKRADILNLSLLGDKKFDVIFAASVLNYVLGDNYLEKGSKEKADQLIKSLRSVLASGGLLCFAFSDREEMDQRRYDNRMPKHIVESFTQAGFEIISEYKGGEVIILKDIGSVADSMQSEKIFSLTADAVQERPDGQSQATSRQLQDTNDDMPNANDELKGGIDFNAQSFDIKTQGDEIDFDVPLELQNIDFNNIQGFVPVIIDIVPITNIFFVLGLNEEDFENDKTRWSERQDIDYDKPKEESLI
ncbi:MAG: methyltransferase domain-containing protein [Candidatus Omnitrophica bacterium]|nr:methyltransferase domain-containing protein [Candidatus Omnitrophota bacterium]